MRNICLEYRESDGWLHHLPKTREKFENSFGFETICKEISSEQALEFGVFMYEKYEKEFKTGNFPTYQTALNEFTEFLKTPIK